jgi:oligoribonuclease NrnB/cAMP/cGMP phosphodiesterase (DHH superfamily)
VWDYLHNTPAPYILQFVADRDVWAWEMPNCDEVLSVLFTKDNDFKVWDEFNHTLTVNPREIINQGQVVVKYRDELVKGLCKDAEMTVLWTNGKVYEGVPMTVAPILHSEVGHKLLVDNPEAPFSMTFQDKLDGTRKYSLRSEDHRADVGEIARSFGGGGHRNAAGFSQDIEEVWREGFKQNVG